MRVNQAIARGRISVPTPVATLIDPRAGSSGKDRSAFFSPLSPMGTAVRSSKPQFTWSDAGAEGYTVAIFDEDVEVARSPRVTHTSWTPDIDLPRGGSYRWQVTAYRGTRSETEPRPPQPDAKFAIVDADTSAAIEAMQSRIAGEPLALGVLLAEAGLVSEARVELARASKMPRTADSAKRLLESLDSAQSR